MFNLIDISFSLEPYLEVAQDQLSLRVAAIILQLFLLVVNNDGHWIHYLKPGLKVCFERFSKLRPEGCVSVAA